jgi:hypothetical protein
VRVSYPHDVQRIAPAVIADLQFGQTVCCGCAAAAVCA